MCIIVSVISATYNRSELIPDLLDQWRKVHKATKYKFEIIFSDDESSDNTVELIEQHKGDLPITILKNKHGGVAKARNKAYLHAIGDLIIFTGDDIFPSENFINLHYETYLKNGENFATLGRIEWRNNIKKTFLMEHITEIGCEQFGFVGLRPYEIADFRHFYTSNISISRKQLQSLDILFDETFKGYGFEDIELSYRLLKKKGVRIYYNPDAIAYHDHIYSSVDKFCNRQLSAGKMLNTFKQLQPGLSAEEIKLDIDEFYNLLNTYKSSKSFWDFSSAFGVLGIKIFKVASKIMEVIINRKNINFCRKICSFMYSAIFAYYFNLGIALQYSPETPKYKLEKFVFRYLSNKYAQVFYADDMNFTEPNSKKIKTLNLRNVDIKIPTNDLKFKRLRLDPLNTNCKIKIIKSEIVKKNLSTKSIEFIFNNGSGNTKSKYNFSRQGDPILLSELLDDDIKEIHFKFKVNYLLLRKILNLVWVILKKIIAFVFKKDKKVSYEQTIINKQFNLNFVINSQKTEKLHKLLFDYQKVCEIFKDVTIGQQPVNNKNTRNYYYNITAEENAITKAQFVNVVTTLLSYDFDFVIVSDSLNPLPKIFANSFIDSIIHSERIKQFVNLKQIKTNYIGKIIFVPGYKQISTYFNLTERFKESAGKNNVLTKGKNKTLNIYNNINVRAIEKRRPVIFVFPIFMAVGGVERNTIEVMKQLKDKFDFVIITFEKHKLEQGSLFYQADNLCLSYFDFAEISSYDKYLDLLSKLKDSYKPDLVWLCNNSPWFADNAANIRRLFNDLPIVAQDVYDFKYGWIEYYERLSFRAYDRYIAVNSKIKQRFINDFSIDEASIDLIYSTINEKRINIVNISDFKRDTILAKYNLDPNKLYFAFIGRVTDQKQPLKFVELAKIITKNHENIQFVMVGDGDLSYNVENVIIKNDLTEKIHRIKYIPNTAEFIKAIDGLIITSLYEGLPIVAIEAMCVGTPILSTDVGDMTFFINKNKSGIITQSDNIEDIVKGFNDLYDNLNEYKQRAEETIKENLYFFSSERAGSLMEECFNGAIEKYSKVNV